MQDLIVLELIIAIILFLAIARPFVKRFQGIDGIAALPALALGALIAVYPAYGFRPELLPLTALSLIMFLGSIPRLVDVLRRLRTDDYGERSFGRLAIGILLLAAATGFAITFAPKTGSSIGTATKAYQETLVRDDTRDVDLYLRYFPGSPQKNGEGVRRPIILIAPPISGSVAVTSSLCTALADRGFFVAIFSRTGTDFPAYPPGGKRIYPWFFGFVRGAVAFVGGTRFAFAAKAGADIERERTDDLAFLVKYVRIAAERRDEPYRDADPERIIVVGYGAGGAAATRYASSSAASSIAAAVAVEGPILSALRGEGPLSVPAPREGAEALKTLLAGICARFRIERIIGTEEVPAPAVPTLFLVSDHIREPESRDGRYATVIRAFRIAKAPSVLASIDGAGPFEYSDVSKEYPVYSALMPGLNERSKKRGYYIERTAALITNFASTVIDSADGRGPLLRSALGGEIQMETGGSWTSINVADILRP